MYHGKYSALGNHKWEDTCFGYIDVVDSSANHTRESLSPDLQHLVPHICLPPIANTITPQPALCGTTFTPRSYTSAMKLVCVLSASVLAALVSAAPLEKRQDPTSEHNTQVREQRL